MPSFIFEDPFLRYVKKRTFMKTKLRTKLLVVRKDQPTQRYSMVIAPTEIDGEPNNVMRALMDLMKLSHCNIVNVHEAYLHNEKCHWIMEDWTDGVSRGMGGLNEDEIADMVRRFVSAFRYMHKHDVVHGNLSIDEIHFFRTENLKLDFKIADLGMGRHVCPVGYTQINQEQRYGCPPEAVRGEFTQKGDVWTVGSVAHFILTGGVNKTRLAERRGSWKEELENASNISEQAKDFIFKCLQQNPDDRATLDELLHHEWFKVGKRSIVEDKQFFTNLMKCDPKNQFKRACLWKLVRLLSYDDLAHARSLWFGLDVHFYGCVDEADFVSALEEGSGMPSEKAQECFEYFDFHNNALLNFCDFCSATLQFQTNLPEEKIREAFYMLDFDGDGVITVGDLSKAVDIPYNKALQYMRRACRQREPEVYEAQFIRIMTGQNIFDALRKRSLELARKSSTMVDEKMRRLSVQAMAPFGGSDSCEMNSETQETTDYDFPEATNTMGWGRRGLPAKHQNLRSIRTLIGV